MREGIRALASLDTRSPNIAQEEEQRKEDEELLDQLEPVELQEPLETMGHVS